MFVNYSSNECNTLLNLFGTHLLTQISSLSTFFSASGHFPFLWVFFFLSNCNFHSFGKSSICLQHSYNFCFYEIIIWKNIWIFNGLFTNIRINEILEMNLFLRNFHTIQLVWKYSNSMQNYTKLYEFIRKKYTYRMLLYDRVKISLNIKHSPRILPTN